MLPLPITETLEEAKRDGLDGVLNLAVPIDPLPHQGFPVRGDVDHDVLAVKAEAELKQAMPMFRVTLATTRRLAAGAARLDQGPTQESGVTQQLA
jgi:hypothetical protein